MSDVVVLGSPTIETVEMRPVSFSRSKGERLLSPVVAHLLSVHDVDPAGPRGRAPGGRITPTTSPDTSRRQNAPSFDRSQPRLVSTDAIRRQPVVARPADGSESIAIHPVGILAMSWGHRAFDGAYAAAFLTRLKEVLECRDWAAEF